MKDNRETILFAVPDDGEKIGYHMIKNMESYGFNVIYLGFPIHQFKYKNRAEHFQHFYQKHLRGKKDFKRILRFSRYQKELERKLNGLSEKADYALIIGADNYPLEFLQKVKAKSKKMVGYTWDGLDVYPLQKERIPLFDAFHVFDPEDMKYQSEYPQILPATNFYFENLIDPDAEKTIDLYYLGGFEKNRIERLEKLASSTKGLKKDLNIISRKELQTHTDEIRLSSLALSYAENLDRLKSSKSVVDLLNDHHQGLSFRTFEAMGNQIKLITTNSSIKKYEFYNEDHIFVLNEENAGEIRDFMIKPTNWDNQVTKKYAFKNWLNYVLDRGEYEAIPLPK